MMQCNDKEDETFRERIINEIIESCKPDEGFTPTEEQISRFNEIKKEVQAIDWGY